MDAGGFRALGAILKPLQAEKVADHNANRRGRGAVAEKQRESLPKSSKSHPASGHGGFQRAAWISFQEKRGISKDSACGEASSQEWQATKTQ